MPVRRLVHQSRWVEDVRVFLRGSKYIDKLAGVLYDMLPGSGNARLSRWDEADEERGQRWQKAEPFAPEVRDTLRYTCRDGQSGRQ